MQHHQHATRASTAVAAPPPPHMLVAGQHMTAKYATAATNTVPAQQQQQQQHHIASVAVATTPGDASYSAQQQQQQHMRDVRLQHQTVYPIPPQTLRGAAPMHKVLQQQQQQQHLNNNNNNKTRNNNINNNKSNNNHHHQQPQPMHTAVLQQHPQHTGSNKVRNINSNGHHHHHHQQPPPPATSAHHYPQHLAYATHINATPSEHMGVATQQQQQTQPPAGAPPPPLPEHQRNGPTATAAYHQQQAATQHHTIPMHGTQQKVPHMAPHHYYNANGHSGGTYTIYTTQPPHVPPLPKQILQNPNRVLKPRQQQQQVSSATATPTTLTPTHRAQSNAPAGGATAAQSTTVTTSNTNEPHEEHQQQPETQQHSNANVIAPSSDNKENVLNLEQIQTDLKKRGEQQHNNEQASNCSSNGSTQHKSNKNNNNQSNILSNEDLSAQKNSKEKTPMCLVNELARFNKIIHQYRLTSEKGPAHCKRFTVTLKLGEEEYSAEGFKIKKAQHLAAAEAIEKTKYKHPVPKTRRNEDSSQPRAHITPTVELNALAMKLGQQTYYLFDPRQMAEGEQLDPAHGMPQQPSPPPTLRGHVGNGAAYQQIQAANGMPMPVPPLPPHPHHARYMHAGHPHAPHGPVHARGMYPPKYPQRYPVINGMIVTGPPVPAERYYTLPPHRPTKITLIVGKQKFVGLGRTLQQAKHDAAARALQVLKTQSAEQQHQQSQEALDTSGSQDGDNKSPISKVHEIGIRRNMSVHFKVLREEGPAHMKNFVTACVVGSIITEGEGNGKKISKKRSAEKMLEELRKLPPLTPTKSPLKRIKVKTPGKMSSASEGTKGGGGGGRGKRAISSALKEKQLEEDNANDEDNPITKLIQIQQGRKEKEPTFELISKNASEHSRRREFIIEVTAQGRVARGTGPNKKVAKRNAAQNLLISMGLLEAPMETTKQNAAVATVPPVPVPTPAAAASVNIINPTNTTNQMTTTSNDPINAHTATAIPNGAETAPVTTTKAIENLEVPLITTPAGQVPGILILRQNKKHASKRKEAVLSVSKETEELNEAAPKHHDAPATTVAPDTTTATSTTHSANAAADSSTQPIKPTSSNGTIESTSSITTLPASTAAPAVTAAVSSNVSSTSNSSSNTTANGKASSVTASSTTTSTSATTTTTSTTSSTTKSSGGVHMKDQLLYLSKLLGFEVNFSDYPKGNHSEFLTIVTLSSDPPQICHGVGANSEESQNDAAKNALKILSELGLNCGKQ